MAIKVGIKWAHTLKREIEDLKERFINEGFRPRQVQTIIKHG
jgi:hypothetical protein